MLNFKYSRTDIKNKKIIDKSNTEKLCNPAGHELAKFFTNPYIFCVRSLYESVSNKLVDNFHKKYIQNYSVKQHYIQKQ